MAEGPDAIGPMEEKIVREVVRRITEEDLLRPRLAWSPAEAAAAVNLPVRRIYNAISRGELPAVRNGRHLRIPDRELRRWIGEQDEHAHPEAS